MNFKDIKQGYPIYILDKKNVEVKQVKASNNSSLPHADAKFGGIGNLVVDISTDDGSTYVMMADADVAYPDGMVVSTEVSYILRELNAMRSTSEQAVRDVPMHEQCIEKCNKAIAELDPAQKEKQQTEARFKQIEQAQTAMQQGMDQLIEMMKKLTE